MMNTKTFDRYLDERVLKPSIIFESFRRIKWKMLDGAQCNKAP